MTKYDRISALFFVVVALFICEESIRMGTGSLSNPGPGLLPLGCGLGLGIFGIIILATTLRGSPKVREVVWRPGTRWWNIIATLASITVFAFLLDLLGFFLVTFIWVGFMCRGVGRMGWKATIFTSVVTTFLSKLLFQHYLNVRFPRGILGF